MASGIVIIGSGQSGFQAAASLREAGFEEPITLIGEERHLPYQRPPLSKAYIAGKIEARRLALRPEAFFDKNRINLLTGEKVTRIDRAECRVQLATGRALEYTHLVLATGTRNRLLPMAGADLQGVFYLRTLDEAEVLRQHLAPGIEIVVIGAGFIGLEFAAVAGELRAKVTVIEIEQRAMARSVSPEMSQFYARMHAEHGSRLIFESGVKRILGADGKVAGVQLTDGRTLPADLVLAGIGVVPNVELAAAAGLSVGNGVVVDEYLLTADEKISAIGDCAINPHPFASQPVRLESVQNAGDQARAVAARLTGRRFPYSAVPWFWSDQGPYKLQIVGLTAGADRRVMRGDPFAGAFSIFCFTGDQFRGVESVNRVADHVIGRRLLEAGVPLSPEIAADSAVDLKALVPVLERVPA